MLVLFSPHFSSFFVCHNHSVCNDKMSLQRYEFARSLQTAPFCLDSIALGLQAKTHSKVHERIFECLFVGWFVSGFRISPLGIRCLFLE